LFFINLILSPIPCTLAALLYWYFLGECRGSCLNQAEIILIKPNFGVSTVQAYQDFSKLKKINYANLDNIEKAINDNNLKYIDGNIKNVLEQSLFENDQIIEFKKKLAYLVENKNFYMSGSGSCFYTFCEKEEVNSILLKLQKEINGFFIKHCKLI